MNISEANAVSRLLRWLIGDQGVQVERAREDAEWLAARSYSALTSGITQQQVAERWLRPTATDTAAVPAETVSRVGRVIDQWLDGEIAPHDALSEIQQLVGDR